jgi:hypothetical protein
MAPTPADRPRAALTFLVFVCFCKLKPDFYTTNRAESSLHRILGQLFSQDVFHEISHSLEWKCWPPSKKYKDEFAIEQVRSNSDMSDLYYRGITFESRRWDRLSWLRAFVVFLGLSRKFRDNTFEYTTTTSFQILTIHEHFPTSSVAIIYVVETKLLHNLRPSYYLDNIKQASSHLVPL